MPTPEEFFLNSPASIAQLETLEISHSNFSQTYWLVRNKTDGLTATLEDLVTSQDFDYYPMKITPLSNADDLDQALQITFGDLGSVLPAEIDLVSQNNGFEEKPVVKYRSWRSDDLTEPMYGPYTLEVVAISFDTQGATFEAKAPTLNISKTGELYTLSRFSMMRGFF